MNPVSTTTWAWRAFRGHSLTFSVLFASALFGISILGWFRHLLHAAGAPWYVWLLLPFFIVSMLAKNEARWVPDAEKRQRWSRWIVVGSIAIVVIAAKLAPDKDAISGADRAWPSR